MLVSNTFIYPFGDDVAPVTFPGQALSLTTGETLKETGSDLVGGNQETVTWNHS